VDEARQEVYVENIEAHYEDIESLNKLELSYAYLTLSETCKELRFTKCIQNIQLVASTSSKINICYLQI